MTKIDIEIGTEDLKTLVLKHLSNLLNVDDLSAANITIEVKSKQNYKSEWESAEFRAKVIRFVDLK